MADRQENCDDDKGCERFKETLKLTDLPTNGKTAAFRGPRYAGVTGDLRDLAGHKDLTTLAFTNSPQITGDIKSLKALTELTHLDFAGSPLLRGNVDDIKGLAKLTYINLASAQRVGGTLESLPKKLVFANFRSALRLKGKVDNIGDGECNLKELDLGSAQGEAITGVLEKTTGGAKGLFKRCAKLTYVDLGGVYGPAAAHATKVVGGEFKFPATKCVKANGLASKGCK